MELKWRIGNQTLIPVAFYFYDSLNLQWNSLYRAAHFENLEGILGFSLPSIVLVKVGLMEITDNVTCSPSLAENDSRLLKNSEGNRDGECIFCWRKEADVALFLQVSRMRKIIKICEANLTTRLLPELRTITKQRALKHESNKTNRDPPITKHKPWPFELVQV